MSAVSHDDGFDFDRDGEGAFETDDGLDTDDDVDIDELDTDDELDPHDRLDPGDAFGLDLDVGGSDLHVELVLHGDAGHDLGSGFGEPVFCPLSDIGRGLPVVGEPRAPRERGNGRASDPGGAEAVDGRGDGHARAGVGASAAEGDGHRRAFADDGVGPRAATDAGAEARAAAEAWVAEALALVRAACERRLPAWRRRLAQHCQPRDPVADLLALAARRVVRLPEPVRRRLPEQHLGEVTRALLRLSLADRRVLLEPAAEAGPEGGSAPLEHRAAALSRLVRSLRVSRRSPRR